MNTNFFYNRGTFNVVYDDAEVPHLTELSAKESAKLLEQLRNRTLGPDDEDDPEDPYSKKP